jgi:hypothetical protein
MVFCGGSHDYFNRVKAAEESSAFDGLRDVVPQARSIADRLISLSFAARRSFLCDTGSLLKLTPVAGMFAPRPRYRIAPLRRSAQ